jgi:hypothetical protein
MTTQGWHVIGASVQGTAHSKSDTPCQDTHGYCLLPNGTLIAAVADGAGSADRSAEGAALAVAEILDLIAATINVQQPSTKAEWHTVLTSAFAKTHHALAMFAEAEESPRRVFATTLTCAVVTNHWLAVAQIGDGVAIAQNETGELFLTLTPQRGEYANETTFLTMEEALDHVEIEIYHQPVQALVLMTDGLIRLAMNVSNNTPHSPFFQPLLTFAAQVSTNTQAHDQLTAFLSSERVCARTDDDKTLVLAVRNN